MWKACVRLGVKPPGVPDSWENMGVITQALVLAFDQVMTHDEDERSVALAGG